MRLPHFRIGSLAAAIALAAALFLNTSKEPEGNRLEDRLLESVRDGGVAPGLRTKTNQSDDSQRINPAPTASTASVPPSSKPPQTFIDRSRVPDTPFNPDGTLSDAIAKEYGISESQKAELNRIIHEARRDLGHLVLENVTDVEHEPFSTSIEIDSFAAEGAEIRERFEREIELLFLAEPNVVSSLILQYPYFAFGDFGATPSKLQVGVESREDQRLSLHIERRTGGRLRNQRITLPAIRPTYNFSRMTGYPSELVPLLTEELQEIFTDG